MKDFSSNNKKDQALHINSSGSSTTKKIALTSFLASALVALLMLATATNLYQLYLHASSNKQNEDDAKVKNLAVLPVTNHDDCSSSSSSSSLQNNNNKHQHRYSWPSQPQEKVGYPIVQKGDNFVLNMRSLLFSKQPHQQQQQDTDNIKGENKNLRTTMTNNDVKDQPTDLFKRFLEVYKNRPDKVNMCGIRINHALALFTAVSVLQPTTVIESGVNAGQSTYFIRQASSTTKIIAIDPLEEPICKQEKRWMDPTGLTEYKTGNKFQDIYDIDWKGMAERKEFDPNTTLAFLDDHLEVLTRIPALMKAEIRHVIVEDNYEFGKGATQPDRAGMTPKQLLATNSISSNWLFHNMISYTEFPPIIPSSMAKAWTGKRKPAGGFMVAADDNLQTMEPILRPDMDKNDMELFVNMSKFLDIDPTLQDDQSYMQFMCYNFICYFEAVPMSPHILGKW